MQTIPTPLHPGKAGAKHGKPCRVCSLHHKLAETIDQKLRGGETVQRVHRWMVKNLPPGTVPISYDVLARHNREHVKLIDRAATKLTDAQRMRRDRIDTAKAVLNDEIDPVAYFSPAEIGRDIKRTAERLDSAATEAYLDGEHASLSALSNSLLRSHELRGKLGGSISDATQVSLSVSLGELHGRLDGILGAAQDDRQNAAGNLLGLRTDVPQNLAAQADLEPARVRDHDPTNPVGEPLTIDAEPTPSESEPVKPYQESAGPRFRPGS